MKCRRRVKNRFKRPDCTTPPLAVLGLGCCVLTGQATGSQVPSGPLRQFIGSPMVRVLATVVTLLLAGAERATVHAQPSDQSFFMRDLGSGVWAALTNPAAKAGSVANPGFVIGNDGVIVIDSAPIAGKALLSGIRQRTKLPIRFVVNTHYHPDHVGDNGVFVGAGATVLAHRNVRGWIHTENLKFFGDKITPQQKAEVEAVPAPNAVYDNGVDVYLDKRAGTRQELSGTHGRRFGRADSRCASRVPGGPATGALTFTSTPWLRMPADAAVMPPRRMPIGISTNMTAMPIARSAGKSVREGSPDRGSRHQIRSNLDAMFDARIRSGRRDPRLRRWLRVGSTSAAADPWEIDRRGDGKRRISVDSDAEDRR